MSLFKSSVTAARDQMTVSSGTTSKSRMRLCALFCAAILASAASVRPTYASCGFAGCPGDSAITAEVQASFNQHPILNLLHVKTLERRGVSIRHGQQRLASRDRRVGRAPGARRNAGRELNQPQ